jgi:hypothetical protein
MYLAVDSTELGTGSFLSHYIIVYSEGHKSFGCPEDYNKLARPVFACILSCVKSLSWEEKRLCYAPLFW